MRARQALYPLGYIPSCRIIGLEVGSQRSLSEFGCSVVSLGWWDQARLLDFHGSLKPLMVPANL